MKRSVGIKPAIIPTPVLLIGTYDLNGNPNMMTAAWGGVCSSQPVSICFAVQKSRYTYEALVNRKECTISIPDTEHLREADYAGIKSGREIDKFTTTGFKAIRSSLVDAPYIEECPVVIECRISGIHEIGVHVLFIAEVMDVKVDERLADKDGRVDTSRTSFVSYDPLMRSYRSVGEIIQGAFISGDSFSEKKK